MMTQIAQIVQAARNELIERGVIAPDATQDDYKIDFCDGVAEVTMHGWLVLLWRLNIENAEYEAILCGRGRQAMRQGKMIIAGLVLLLM